MLVTAAALELKHVSLADALAVCLVYRDRDPPRFERAAVRWLSRFCRETPAVSVADVQLLVAALAGLVGPARAGAARLLGELADAYGHAEVAQVLDDWQDHHRAT